MSIILFIVLFIALRFFFDDFGLVILVSLGAAIWLCAIRIFFKVDNIEKKAKNIESKYDEILKYISDTSDKAEINNISDDTNDVEIK